MSIEGSVDLRLAALTCVAGASALALACAMYAWRAKISFELGWQRRQFAAQEPARGEELARIGNCMDCHTRPGGAEPTGQRALMTPLPLVLGQCHARLKIGIGDLLKQAIVRAMRDVDAKVRHHDPCLAL